MIRDQLIQCVAASQTPVSTAAVAAATGLGASVETLAAVDLLLTLSPEVSAFSDSWVASADTRDRRTLNALRAYTEAHPDKRIFRVTAALGQLPAEDQMTEQQLQELLSRSDEFHLMANAMIKRGA